MPDTKKPPAGAGGIKGGITFHEPFIQRARLTGLKDGLVPRFRDIDQPGAVTRIRNLPRQVTRRPIMPIGNAPVMYGSPKVSGPNFTASQLVSHSARK